MQHKLIKRLVDHAGLTFQVEALSLCGVLAQRPSGSHERMIRRRICGTAAATNMPHIAPSIIQKCRQWSVSMMKLSPTVPRNAEKIAR